MNREELKNMSHSLRAFSKKKCLQDMTTEELTDLPKEVIIACVTNEIAYVCHKLPECLKKDPEIAEHKYCTEHYSQRKGDNVDHPPLRRIFCCYCKVKEVNVGSSNQVKMAKIIRKRGSCTCCTIK